MPQFKNGSLLIYKKKLSVKDVRQIKTASLANLVFSKILLFLGIVFILLNNLNVLEPGSYFGALNYVTIIVFSIGIFINFISIPFLYFSSFNNFKAENDFWDKEIFWILPLFFFGTFFIYASEVDMSFIIFIISILVIAAIHFKFIHASWELPNMRTEQMLSGCHQQYNSSLKYLTAYYTILLFLLIVYNPIQEVFIWIRMHA